MAAVTLLRPVTGCSSPPASRAHGSDGSGLLLGILRHRWLLGRRTGNALSDSEASLWAQQALQPACGVRRRSWAEGVTVVPTQRRSVSPAPAAPTLGRGGGKVTARQLLTQPLLPAWELPGDLSTHRWGVPGGGAVTWLLPEHGGSWMWARPPPGSRQSCHHS